MSRHPAAAGIAFENGLEWQAWLDDNHAIADEVWAKIAKKATGIDSVHYPEVLEIALCYGWIDGRRVALDEQFFLQRFGPRRPRSTWSKLNRDTAINLIALRRMRPAGLAEVQRAQADGRWAAAYDSPRRIEIPADLQRELDCDSHALASFTQLNSQRRYAILYGLHSAKKPETRARRLGKLIATLQAGTP